MFMISYDTLAFRDSLFFDLSLAWSKATRKPVKLAEIKLEMPTIKGVDQCTKVISRSVASIPSVNWTWMKFLCEMLAE